MNRFRTEIDGLMKAVDEAVYDSIRERVKKQFDQENSEEKSNENILPLDPIPDKVALRDLGDNGKLYSDVEIIDLMQLYTDLLPQDIEEASKKLHEKMTSGNFKHEEKIEVSEVREIIKKHARWNPLPEGRIPKDELRECGLDVKFSAFFSDKGLFFMYKGEGADKDNPRHQARPERDKNRHLGKGDFGKVKLLQTKEGKWAVVKVISKASGKRAAKKQKANILHEIKMLKAADQFIAAYQRPNQKDETKYEMIMKYCPGKPFHDAIGKVNPAYDTFRAIRGSLYAIRNLHVSGILHLVIKGDNLRFDPSECNIENSVHPVDLGLAKSIDEPYGYPQGSPAFLAPEIFKAVLLRKEKVQYSTAVDVFALGKLWAHTFDMLKGNEIYTEDEFSASAKFLAATLRLRENPDENVDLYLIKQEHSSKFIHAIPDDKTRSQVLHLMHRMTDPIPQNRPSIEKCIKTINGKVLFPEFANIKPNIGELYISNILNVLIPGDNHPDVNERLEKIKKFDHAVLINDNPGEFSMHLCRDVEYILRLKGISNIANIVLVPDEQHTVKDLMGQVFPSFMMDNNPKDGKWEGMPVALKEGQMRMLSHMSMLSHQPILLSSAQHEASHTPIPLLSAQSEASHTPILSSSAQHEASHMDSIELVFNEQHRTQGLMSQGSFLFSSSSLMSDIPEDEKQKKVPGALQSSQMRMFSHSPISSSSAQHEESQTTRAKKRRKIENNSLLNTL